MGNESWQTGSDVGVQVLLVARDGIRFQFGGVRTPYHAEPPAQALPPRHVWVQAASPPPDRVDSRPWYAPYERESGVPWLVQGSDEESSSSSYKKPPKLGKPDAGTIVLDQQITAPFQWAREADFALAEVGDPMGFLSNQYEQPDGRVGVDFYGEYELAWVRPLREGAWVALSFDRFDPDAYSAAWLVRVTDAWLFRPPEQPDPKAPAAS